MINTSLVGGIPTFKNPIGPQPRENPIGNYAEASPNPGKPDSGVPPNRPIRRHPSGPPQFLPGPYQHPNPIS